MGIETSDPGIEKPMRTKKMGMHVLVDSVNHQWFSAWFFIACVFQPVDPSLVISIASNRWTGGLTGGSCRATAFVERKWSYEPPHIFHVLSMAPNIRAVNVYIIFYDIYMYIYT